MVVYDNTCTVCHGANASVSYTADLRRSGALHDPAVWKAVVIDGALKERGMVAFNQILTPQDAENVRAYVIRQAKKGAAAAPGK
jgi:quinohemoprotein ethanol dehydrogenase